MEPLESKLQRDVSQLTEKLNQSQVEIMKLKGGINELEINQRFQPDQKVWVIDLESREPVMEEVGEVVVHLVDSDTDHGQDEIHQTKYSAIMHLSQYHERKAWEFKEEAEDEIVDSLSKC